MLSPILLVLGIVKMNCYNCGKELADDSQIFFYVKGQKEVYLAIKPELKTVFEEKKTIIRSSTSEKKPRIECSECNSAVGRILPFGPGNWELSSFSCQKVKIRQMSYFGKKWYNIQNMLPIESRDTWNFFKDHAQIQKQKINSIRKKVFIDPVYFPSVEIKKDFEWFTTLITKVPRDYQIEAFVEGLQRNIVIVLNTGAGKTLIASMILAKMCELNSGRMGLMIVDRVPLAFQHRDAIAGDTYLKVVSACGQNMTENIVREINHEYYDILVATAGAFYEMLEKEYLDLSLFCCLIFDECHHLSGKHRYVDVMKKFTSQKVLHQPRIIGLTASPFSADTIMEGEKKLKKFLTNFPDAKVYAPLSQASHQKMVKELISLSSEQEHFTDVAVDKINWHLFEIARVHPAQRFLLKRNLNNIDQIIGELRPLQTYYSQKQKLKNVQYALLLMEALEYSIYFGVPSSYNFLKDEGVFEKMFDQFHHVAEVSERLQVLCSYLKKATDDSKILVFVDKRSIARFLTRWIQKEFPDLDAQMVVGHGGYDGMMWEGQNQQYERIQNFAKGDSRLIVTTSVLEEGIDVAQCDLVIAFMGSRSLIKFIQMRGRARKHGSAFVVFETEEERLAKQNVENQEKVMRSVLERYQLFNFSERSKTLVGVIKSQCKSVENLGDTLSYSDLSIIRASGNELVFKMFIDPLERIEIQEMKRHVREHLQKFNFFTLKRFECVRQKGIFASNDVFSSEAQMFVAYITSNSHSMSSLALYREFVNYFDYYITIYKAVHQIWSDIEVGDFEDLTEAQRVDCKSFSVGYFQNRSSIVLGKVFELASKVVFNSRKSITIELFVDDAVVYKIEIKFPAISKFSFLSVNKDDTVLYVNLTQVPLFSIRDERICHGEMLHYFSSYPLLMLTFSSTHYLKLQDIFHSPSLFPLSIFQTKLQISEKPESVHAGRYQPWAMKCITDCREVCFPPDTRDRILNYIEVNCSTHNPKNVKDLCESILLKLSQTSYRYFTDLYQEFLDTFSATINTPLANDLLVDKVIPENVFQIKRVTVTPTRVISLPKVLIASNRFLREMEDRNEDVIIVRFRDDDTTKVLDSSLVPYYEGVLSSFIEINKKKYRYLFSTGSQMREHKGYFVHADTYKEVLKLRERFVPDIGQFSSIAKYISRLGLYGTTAAYAMDVTMDSIIQVDDMKAENGDLTTDGAGLISLSVAKKLAYVLELDETPSAFQIRYSGFKGVVSCTYENDPQLGGKSFLMRKSMQKFKNGDRKFCVAKYSKYHKVYLNREILNLLSSIKDFDIQEILLQYMDKELDSLVSIFENEKIALDYLQSYLPKDDMKLIYDSRFSFIENAHWFEVLKGIYRLRSMEIKNKMNILIDDGAYLMGVPDPYGVLKGNEVFVQVRKDESSTSEIINKRAFIYRNPCLHPGDHRIVQCVDNERLHHLSNVVVLPALHCKTSLAAECSGGDLDGDHFSVIWDGNLVPAENFQSCHYSALNVEGIRKKEENLQSPTQIAKFLADFLTNDELGKIAQKHLAFCDIEPLGARSDLAIELAKCQAQAVDYPKTGIKPKIPKEVIKIVSERGYPDFMQKRFEVCYDSEKTLGQLYRYCKEVTLPFEPGMKQHPDVRDDLEFMYIDGFEKYLNDAESVYEFYRYHIEMIMGKYKLRSEVDVILASATYGWEDEMEENKGKISETIKEWYENIKARCRILFFSNIVDEQDKLRKAYAWYFVVCNKKPSKSRFKYVGFPWMVADYICKIRNSKDTVTPSRTNYTIGESAVQLFKQKCKIMSSDIQKKIDYVKEVERTINQYSKEKYQVSKGFIVQPYGSTSLYVSELESDIDICVYATPVLYSNIEYPPNFSKLTQDKQQIHFLHEIISRAVDSLASNKRNVNVDPPLIKFQSSNTEDPISCDISMNINGLRKTYYFHYLFKTDWVYFIVFWTLVKWARAADLIRPSADAEKRVIDTAEFYALIIYILSLPKSPPIDIINQKRVIKLSELTESIFPKKLKRVDLKERYHQAGEMIFSFFREISKKRESITIKWSKICGSEDVEDVKIKKGVMNDIAILARKAFHYLSIQRNVEGLINYFMESEFCTEFSRDLPTATSFAIGKAKQFHSTLLAAKTGARVQINTIHGKRCYRVLAKGTRLQLKMLREEIQSLRTNTNALVLLGRLPKSRWRYFVAGSSKLFSLQDTKHHSRVKIENSLGAYIAIHHLQERGTLILQDVDDKCKEEHEREQYERFKAHVKEQMGSFPAEKKDLLGSLEVVTRFGCFYVLNVSTSLPSASKSIPFQELEIALEKGRRTRKNWERGEFVADDDRNKASTRPR